MGKNKLKKFAELESLECVLQYPRERLVSEGFPYKGHWNREVFLSEYPIVLELGCGKGEYTTALADACKTKNFIGIDIKGARVWKGAKEVTEKGLQNARFLRTEIENLSQFFGPDEIDEILITFPDPQMQKTRKRLTSTRFLKQYAAMLKPEGVVNLKTDSPFLYEYTRRLVYLNGLTVLEDTDDLYGSGKADPVSSIKTFYESQWLSRGKSIKLLSFRLKRDIELEEPSTDDIPKDNYHAFTRHNPSLNAAKDL